MNAFIIYKGKYEATHQYAKWLAAAVHYPVFRTDEVEGKLLANQDCVIVGGSVYMGKWQASKWVKQNLIYLKNKKLFIFIVCGTEAENNVKLDEIARNNIPEEIRNQSSIHFLHGRLIREKLSWKDRLFLKLGASLAKDPGEKAKMLKDFDDVKKENIQPLIAEILKYQNLTKVKNNIGEPAV
jgi:menaquinone-dependent protoporphyrinogen IX oxidase